MGSIGGWEYSCCNTSLLPRYNKNNVMRLGERPRSLEGNPNINMHTPSGRVKHVGTVGGCG